MTLHIFFQGVSGVPCCKLAGLLWLFVSSENKIKCSSSLFSLQSAPLDIRSDDFFGNRQDVIEQRLTELREADEEGLLTRLGSSWEEYNGEQCTGVRWDLFNDLDHAKV